jgi:ElaB/YqjD/DUF883 family membrane-anchored ribosome-binding protein
MNATDIKTEAKKDPEMIERDIGETRQEVNQTLDALQSKLSPGQWMDRALGFVRENGGEFAQNLGGTIRENPIPVILTGIGVLWMIASRASSASSSQAEYEDFTSPDFDTNFGGKLSSAADSARERATGLAGTVSEKVGDAKRAATWQAQRAREGFSNLMEEQPMILGAVGVAVGALLGMALPSTRQEDRLLGRARDEGLERAKAVGAQQYEKVKDVATHAVEEVIRPGSEGRSGADTSNPEDRPPLSS